MLEIIAKADIKKRWHGGKPNKLTLVQQLEMTLEYLHEYPTYFHLGERYKIAQNTCFRNVKWVEDTLIKSGEFSLPNKQDIMEDKNIKTVIIDATNAPIEKLLKKHRKNIEKT